MIQTIVDNGVDDVVPLLLEDDAKRLQEFASQFNHNVDDNIRNIRGLLEHYRDIAAGGIRNKQMLNEGKPDLVIAFPTENSKGTWDMVRRAKRAGIETVVVG